ncbi:MAG: GNAT family N-acetyltransferase, partial [Methanomicrobiales archaeon]|nr:GNAT family N-acetyltransferase [Methanomicrobiales archaeon]
PEDACTMEYRILTTPHLDLVPATLDLLTLELWDLEQLGIELAAIVPPSWPPEGITAEVLQHHILFATSPEPLIWDFLWILRGTMPDERRVLIGTGGFTRQDATLVLGYAVLPEYRGLGYGTEAVHALTEWAFRDPEVEQVEAITYAHLTASVRVLEKNGFLPSGKGEAEGSLRFLRRRESS